MRYLFGFLCVCALGVMPLVGCGDTTGTGGQGGMAGINGGGGNGGGPNLCYGVDCNDHDACTTNLCDFRDGSCGYTPVICDDDNECTDDDCNPLDGCRYTPVADGTSCGAGAAACEAGSCVGTFPCTEAGIRHAIAVGAGPHTFLCAGPTTVVTEAEIIIDNNVILDAEGNLTVDAGYHGGEFTGDEHIVFVVRRFTSSGNEVAAELHGFRVTGGWSRSVGGISNRGMLTLTNTSVSGNAGEHVGGISNDKTLTMVNCTVFENWSWEGVGGIRNGETLTLTNSSVSDNGGQQVGGIENSGFRASLSMTNSTVSGNSGSLCDGIDTEGRTGSGAVTMANSTVLGDTRSVCANVLYTGKTAGDPGLVENVDVGAGASGGAAGWSGQFTLANCLVLGDCTGDIAITSDGYNIESPGDTCGFDQQTDQGGVTAQQLNLGELADNGGPTMTHALLTEPTVSVAIDHIPAVDCEVTEDQRGQPRPETGGTMCDVGAFEVQP
jgi:hypothetical protein